MAPAHHQGKILSSNRPRLHKIPPVGREKGRMGGGWAFMALLLGVMASHYAGGSHSGGLGRVGGTGVRCSADAAWVGKREGEVEDSSVAMLRLRGGARIGRSGGVIPGGGSGAPSMPAAVAKPSGGGRRRGGGGGRRKKEEGESTAERSRPSASGKKDRDEDSGEYEGGSSWDKLEESFVEPDPVTPMHINHQSQLYKKTAWPFCRVSNRSTPASRVAH